MALDPRIFGAEILEMTRRGRSFGGHPLWWKTHYRLSREAVGFWDVHELADAEHSDVGDHIVVRHATTDAIQAGVREAVRTSLRMWWQFFDDMDRHHGQTVAPGGAP